MEPFNKWLRNYQLPKQEEVAKEPNWEDPREFSLWVQVNNVDLDLAMENEGVPPHLWTYPCHSCSEQYEINCEPWEFDPDMHYCGKDKYCMP